MYRAQKWLLLIKIEKQKDEILEEGWLKEIVGGS